MGRAAQGGPEEAHGLRPADPVLRSEAAGALAGADAAEIGPVDGIVGPMALRGHIREDLRGAEGGRLLLAAAPAEIAGRAAVEARLRLRQPLRQGPGVA